ncbi:putative uncharacterized protein [Aliivibrio wodanis]|uniref:Uncharacterized protein n=1 Tax=Aliivibrio wodanis TaxID=80852 RepID=A0A090I750_9GAMM|nr:putative uncharacterized protein [Aliivibrio wodanis]
MDFGDIPTWIAAIGSTSTLVFLIKQHFDNRKHDLAIWDEQKGVIRLESLEKHRSLFTLLLKEIEDDKESVSFKGVNFLYKRIFQKNGINSFFTKPPQDHEHNSDYIFSQFEADLKAIGDSELYIYNNKDHQKVEGLFDALSVSKDKLNFEYTRKKCIGDALFQGKVSFNIFELDEHFKFTFNTVDTLRDFAGLNGIVLNFSVASYSYSPFCHKALYDCIEKAILQEELKLISKNSYLSKWNIFEPYEGLFNFLVKLRKLINEINSYGNGIELQTLSFWDIKNEGFNNRDYSKPIREYLQNLSSEVIKMDKPAHIPYDMWMDLCVNMTEARKFENKLG